MGIDRDPLMLARAREYLKQYGGRVQTYQGSYAQMDRFLIEGCVDYILLDIGVNRAHFDDAERGFSLNQDGPLDMRFDPDTKMTAGYLLKNYSLDQLTDILEEYADYKPRKRAEHLAQLMFQHRRKNPLKTTNDFKELLSACKVPFKAMPPIFQAVRIAVNGELDELKIFLQKLPDLLAPGGRCAIITFHSIEERIVK